MSTVQDAGDDPFELSKQSDIERAKVLGAQKFLVKAAVSLDQIVAEVRDLCK